MVTVWVMVSAGTEIYGAWECVIRDDGLRGGDKWFKQNLNGPA